MKKRTNFATSIETKWKSFRYKDNRNIIFKFQDSLRQKRQQKPLFYFPYANRQKSQSRAKKDHMVIYQIKQELIEEDLNYIRRQTRNESFDGPVLCADEFDFL